MFKKNKTSSSDIDTEPVTSDTPPPSSGNQPNTGDTNATGAAQKPKLYAVSYLLKQNNMQLTEAPWCIGKTAMTEEDFQKGKDEWFNKDKKEETASPDDGNTEDNN